MLTILSNIVTKLFLPVSILTRISTEEKRKRLCVVAVTLIAIPFLLGYGIVHLSIGEGIENSMADLLTAGLFIATLVFLRSDVDGRIAYRGDWAREERAMFEAAGHGEGDALDSEFFPRLWQAD